jgi:hypothetical protein
LLPGAAGLSDNPAHSSRVQMFFLCGHRISL